MNQLDTIIVVADVTVVEYKNTPNFSNRKIDIREWVNIALATTVSAIHHNSIKHSVFMCTMTLNQCVLQLKILLLFLQKINNNYTHN